jgi:hypothetical protein
MVQFSFFFRARNQKEIAMHVKGFLHKTFTPVMHKKRISTLSLAVQAALDTQKLSLTGLGREMAHSIQPRSGIRKADRLLGNENLHKERMGIYGILLRSCIGNRPQPWFIVDWSEVPNTSHHILRIAYIAQGRAITIYEEVHPEKKLGNAKVEKNFLQTFAKMLPENCWPVIVTDAGFHNNWFREVLALGWDYVGRIRSGKKYSLNDGKTWHHYTKLFSKATSTPKSLGKAKLCRRNVLETNLYIFKEVRKGRSSLNRAGKKRRDTNTLDHRKSAREGWVLASSLSGRSMAKRVVKIYKKRMQIEEAFRDLKSSRYGLGFEDAYSKKIKRIEILLLIAALASFIAWLVGWIAEQNKLHYQFQSNSIKDRRVLSFFYLGREVIKRRIKISINMLKIAIKGGLVYA